MKGAALIIETILLAAAIILFLIALISTFNRMTTDFTRERIRHALRLDAEKVAYSILMARDLAGESGEATVYPELTANLQPTIWVEGGYLRAKAGGVQTRISLYGLDSYVQISGRIKGTRIQKPYVRASSGAIQLGVE